MWSFWHGIRGSLASRKRIVTWLMPKTPTACSRPATSATSCKRWADVASTSELCKDEIRFFQCLPLIHINSKCLLNVVRMPIHLDEVWCRFHRTPHFLFYLKILWTSYTVRPGKDEAVVWKSTGFRQRVVVCRRYKPYLNLCLFQPSPPSSAPPEEQAVSRSE